MRKYLDKVNIVKHVCHHMLGENHTAAHRITVGVGVMICGVILSKVHTEIYVLHLFFDGSGYMLHGFGAIPIFDHLIKQTK